MAKPFFHPNVNQQVGKKELALCFAVPEGMRDELREEARKNRRSMNAEIVSRLQTTLDRGVFTLQLT